jgi:hypothetical protein
MSHRFENLCATIIVDSFHAVFIQKSFADIDDSIVIIASCSDEPGAPPVVENVLESVLYDYSATVVGAGAATP